MLREGRERKCPMLEDIIYDAVINSLNKAGIDRFSITSGYTHGLNSDVKQILDKIFPNLSELERIPVESTSLESSVEERKESASELMEASHRRDETYRSPPSLSRTSRESVKPSRRRKALDIIITLVASILFIMIVVAIIMAPIAAIMIVISHFLGGGGGVSFITTTSSSLGNQPVVIETQYASSSTTTYTTTTSTVVAVPRISVYSGLLSVNPLVNACIVINAPSNVNQLAINASSNLPVIYYVFGPFKSFINLNCRSLPSSSIIYGLNEPFLNIQLTIQPNFRYYIVIYNPNSQEASVNISALLLGTANG